MLKLFETSKIYLPRTMTLPMLRFGLRGAPTCVPQCPYSQVSTTSASTWQWTQAPVQPDSSDVCDGDGRTWLGSVRLYSSSLSYSGAVCWAGLSAVRAGMWLRVDSSFSVFEAGGAVFMGGAVRAARCRGRGSDKLTVLLFDELVFKLILDWNSFIRQSVAFHKPCKDYLL